MFNDNLHRKVPCAFVDRFRLSFQNQYYMMKKMQLCILFLHTSEIIIAQTISFLPIVRSVLFSSKKCPVYAVNKGALLLKELILVISVCNVGIDFDFVRPRVCDCFMLHQRFGMQSKVGL